MLGVVLCGGQSTRMGSDKGLLTSNQYTWAQEAAAKLTALSMPVLVSVNSRQLESYATLYESSFLIPDDTTLRLGGPLSGILSVHRKFPKEDLMVLACDMLLMESFILRELYDARQEHPASKLIFLPMEEILNRWPAFILRGPSETFLRNMH